MQSGKDTDGTLARMRKASMLYVLVFSSKSKDLYIFLSPFYSFNRSVLDKGFNYASVERTIIKYCYCLY